MSYTPGMTATTGGTVPTPPNDPNQVLRGDGTWGYVRLFSQYAQKQVTNTTTKTSLFGTGDGSPIVPANYFNGLGVMANLIMMGSWSKSVGGALTLLIECTDSGGTQEIHRKEFTNSQLGGGGSTAGHWEIRQMSTCYATGATGTLFTHASLTLLENNSAEILGVHSETSGVTVDLTGTIEFVVTAQWTVASTSLSIGSANVILQAQ